MPGILSRIRNGLRFPTPDNVEFLMGTDTLVSQGLPHVDK